MRGLRNSVYLALISCYPRGFRLRFGLEMLATLDEAADQSFGRLLADFGLSVLRQWITWDRAGEPERRTCTVVGSVLTGEYPGMTAEMPSSLRLVQAALVCCASCCSGSS